MIAKNKEIHENTAHTPTKNGMKSAVHLLSARCVIIVNARDLKRYNKLQRKINHKSIKK